MDPSEAASEPRVEISRYFDRLTLNCTVERAEFDPQPLLNCFPEAGRRGDAANCSAMAAVNDPNGRLVFGSSRHETDVDTHHHVFVLLDFTSAPASDAQPLDDILACIGAHLQNDVRATLSAEAFFPQKYWKTALGLPRTAQGMLPGLPEGSVSVAGVELDLSNTSLKVERLSVSLRGSHMYVAIDYPRKLSVSADLGSNLIREASEIIGLFVIQRDAPEISNG